jgi:AbrB family looped-hinge helix DNA binding protein
MNAHVDIRTVTNMTSKGQVLIPKEIRDRLGLVPGRPVRVGINDRGEAVILPSPPPLEETPEQKTARIRDAIDDLAGKYATGQSTEEYMAEIRGPYDDLP